ncbi:zinc ribbon domain-containing protein [Pseudoalteromonas sp. KS88]|uniref:zinc ribbon domain-containing protein n=1 Tax=Pseudoalteromonas sp. KS88 TaxID=2109918 RepID=UPI0010801932|nr:zinc ribbon domain-containing protein [Pseudoalteromonas sp. KS88]
MALIKCKECGAEVSSKAKTCPKCGAKPAKKTSLITWFVLILIVYLVYSASQRSTPNSNYKKPVLTEKSDIKAEEVVKEKAEKIKPLTDWLTTSATDEMTGKVTFYAASKTTYPVPGMKFPYSDVDSWIGVGCDGKSEWVYFGFSNAPNLTNTSTEDGYSLINTRLKWDDKVETVGLTQDWGSRFIHFREDKKALLNLKNSQNIKLELQWHSQDRVYFNYSLRGSSKAIQEIQQKCSSL